MDNLLLDFLRSLWGHSGWGELRSFDEKGLVTSRFLALDALDRGGLLILDAMADGGDVFFGVLPRVRQRGRAADVDLSQVGTLWADLDPKNGRTRQEILEDLSRIPVPPHFVVDSGRGYHAYWLIRPTLWSFAGDAMEGLANALSGDRVIDPARVMRLPGSMNRKDGIEAEVRIVRMDLTAPRRNISEFSEYAELGQQVERDRATPVSRYYTSLTSSAIASLPFATSDLPGWLRLKLATDPGKGLRSEHVMSIVHSLCELGYSDDAIENIIWRHPDGAGVKYFERGNGRRWLNYALKEARKHYG